MTFVTGLRIPLDELPRTWQFPWHFHYVFPCEHEEFSAHGVEEKLRMVTKQKLKMLLGHFNGILATVHMQKNQQQIKKTFLGSSFTSCPSKNDYELKHFTFICEKKNSRPLIPLICQSFGSSPQSWTDVFAIALLLCTC